MVFGFRDYRSLKELFRDIYYKKFTIEEAERVKQVFNALLGALKKYSSKISGYIKEKINLLGNVEKFYDGRYIIINECKNKIIPLNYYESHLEDEITLMSEIKMILLITKSLID